MRLAWRGRRHPDPAVESVFAAWSDAWMQEFTVPKRVGMIVMFLVVAISGVRFGPVGFAISAVTGAVLLVGFGMAWLAAGRLYRTRHKRDSAPRRNAGARRRSRP